MSKFEQSMILMGIDWSKAAKTKAFKDIKQDSPRIAKRIQKWARSMDRQFRKN